MAVLQATRGFKNMEQEIADNPMEKGKAAWRKRTLMTAIQQSDWPWNKIQIINVNFQLKQETIFQIKRNDYRNKKKVNGKPIYEILYG